METTKKCSRCGQVLSTSEFHKNIKNKDGLQSWCKKCISNYDKYERKDRVKAAGHTLHKIYSNEDLASFTPRQLIEELKARGYRGTLTFQQQIIL